MAWFNNTKDDDLPRVTLDRIAAVLDRYAWPYICQDAGILVGLNGLHVTIRIDVESFLLFTVAYFDVPISVSRLDELHRWAEETNRVGAIGTCYVVVGEDDSLSVVSDHAVVIDEGATDEQLDNWVTLCIKAQLENLESLRKQCGLPQWFDDEES